MMALSQAAAMAGGRMEGADVNCTSVSIDTRTLQPGALFVALQGPNFDGHDFVDAASKRGAAAAMVHRPVDHGLPVIHVDDTRLALGRLAAAWRARRDIPVVAVTGSNGKTTVKEMIAAILAQRGEVLATQGNLNNDIGVPLTLLRLRDSHDCAVIEMGANHPGEIAYVAGLARPTVGVVTNAGAAHLEGFGGLEGVARAKGELFQALDTDGMAVVNADDRFAALWLQFIGARPVLRFGLEQAADVSVVPGTEQMEVGDVLALRCTLRTPAGDIPIRMHLCGRHNVINACAAAAAAGAGAADIQRGLASLQAVKGRLQLLVVAPELRVLDDTYNANPTSLRAALQVLAVAPGKKLLVLGDMSELGAGAEGLHGELGDEARAAGVEQLFTVGELSRFTAQRFGAGARHFTTQEELIAALRAGLNGNAGRVVTILVKGSRRMQMERVVAALASGAAGSTGGA
ncbi:MAG: UDP-N-acetylmuramoyl-tripeptide--D-alanyl-D-alanine ligase [Gammaproteobacteria bacterium]